MAKLIMMVGIAGSGKSTIARGLAEQENAVLLSSDSIREELLGDVNCQDKQVLVFETMYTRARNSIKLGRNVILDATNISSKRRRGILQQFASAEKICIYVNPGYKQCLIRNHARDRKVPVEVINRMYRNLHVPVYHEGWDKIIYETNGLQGDSSFKRGATEKLIRDVVDHDTLFHVLSSHPAFSDICDFPQDTPYHTLSVSRHSWYVYEYINKNYNGEDKLKMLWAGLLHDTGKEHCKNFKEGSRYANFIGHENVSAQLTTRTLSSLGYPQSFIEEVVEIVLLHMRLPWEVEDYKVSAKKLYNLVGTDVFNKLCVFRSADESAR